MSEEQMKLVIFETADHYWTICQKELGDINRYYIKFQTTLDIMEGLGILDEYTEYCIAREED